MTGWTVQHQLRVGKDHHKFSVAHMTVFPDGRKEPLHGHNYYVTLSLSLRDISLKSFVDFNEIKTVLRHLCDRWDEKCLIPKKCPFLELIQEKDEVEFKLCGKRYVFPQEECAFLEVENISAESLAAELARDFVSEWKVSENVIGLEVTVSETRGQSGTATLRKES